MSEKMKKNIDNLIKLSNENSIIDQSKSKFRVMTQEILDNDKLVKKNLEILIGIADKSGKIVARDKKYFRLKTKKISDIDLKLLYDESYLSLIREDFFYEVVLNIQLINNFLNSGKIISRNSNNNLLHKSKINNLKAKLKPIKENIKNKKIYLRAYQVDIINEINNNTKNTIIELPTGSGKTIIALNIIKHELKLGGKVLFLTPKLVLLDQTIKVFKSLNPYRIYANNNDTSHSLLISTLHTMSNRIVPEDITLLIIDEAHYGHNSIMQDIIKKNLICRKIALSATPYDFEGSIIEGYEQYIDKFDINYLTKKRFLVPLKIISPIKINLNGISLLHGDYSIKELDERFNIISEVKKIVNVSIEPIQTRKATIVFAINITHCILLAREYSDQGITSFPIHSKLQKKERDILIEAFNQGLIKVLVAVEQLTTGFDVPHVDTIVIARPTKSINLYTQMIGRVLRPSPSKNESLFIDCAGLMNTLGSLYSLKEYRKNYLKLKKLESIQKKINTNFNKKDDSKVICNQTQYLESFSKRQKDDYSQFEEEDILINNTESTSLLKEDINKHVSLSNIKKEEIDITMIIDEEKYKKLFLEKLKKDRLNRQNNAKYKSVSKIVFMDKIENQNDRTLKNKLKYFLYESYKGYCQICGFTFKKSNENRNSFELFNWNDTRIVKIKKNFLSTADSLCLCRNCVATIKWGSFYPTFLDDINNIDNFDQLDIEKIKEILDSTVYKDIVQVFKNHLNFNDMYALKIKLDNIHKYLYFTNEHIIQFIAYLQLEQKMQD